MDLRARTNLFVTTSKLEPRLLNFPIDVPSIIWDVAFPNPSQPLPSVSDLLDALSLLLGHEVFSRQILACFAEIVVDLLARWLEGTAGIPLKVWESRLTVVAMLPELRAELWRWVEIP